MIPSARLAQPPESDSGGHLRAVPGDAVSQSRHLPADAPLLVLVTDPGEPWVRLALEAGAELVALVTPGDRERRVRPVLPGREEEVLRLVASGLLDKQIARELGIGQSTVKEYIKRIRARYELVGRSAPSRVALARRAIEDGLA